jgi:hypothetical protein
MDMKPLATLRGLLRAPVLRCSFCGRNADSVARLVAGASAHICEQCITKWFAVLEQHGVPPASTATAAREIG